MAKKYFITLTDKPDPLDLQVIRENLEGHYAAQSQPMDWAPLAAIMRDSQGEIIAGVIGGSYWGWFYISRIWVKDRRYSRNYSIRLLKEIEKEIVQRGCGHSFLETQDFESVVIYEKFGYVVVKKTEESGYTRYSMQKELHS